MVEGFAGGEGGVRTNLWRRRGKLSLTVSEGSPHEP